MTKKQTVVVRAVRPQEPERRVGLIRLGKIVLLGLLLITTTTTIATAAIGFVGEANSTTNRFSRQPSVPAVITAPSGQQPVTKSSIVSAAGVGTILFWLGLAAVNLRRKGVKDNRSEKRIPSSMAPIPQGAVRS